MVQKVLLGSARFCGGFFLFLKGQKVLFSEVLYDSSTLTDTL